MLICTICGNMFEGYGNNASPICDPDKDGRTVCCDECNRRYVVPARLFMAKAEGKEPKIGDKVVTFWVYGQENILDYVLRTGIIEDVDQYGQFKGTWGPAVLNKDTDRFCVVDDGDLYGMSSVTDAIN